MTKRKRKKGGRYTPPARAAGLGAPWEGNTVEWHDDGSRTVHIENPETMAALRGQLDAFREKFGREPGPDDPLFFDPDEDEPTFISPAKVEAEMVAGMRAAGIDPAWIYAYQQTGMMLTEGNEHLFQPKDVAEFQDAAFRYRELHEEDV